MAYCELNDAMITFSGHDAFELLRTSYRHEGTLELLRLFLGCRIIAAANRDEAKLAAFREVDSQCQDCVDESIDADISERPAVKEAFVRLFELAGSRPSVKLEVPEGIMQPVIQESLQALTIKSGIQFTMSYLKWRQQAPSRGNGGACES